jgi:hypothetical protein
VYASGFVDSLQRHLYLIVSIVAVRVLESGGQRLPRGHAVIHWIGERAPGGDLSGLAGREQEGTVAVGVEPYAVTAGSHVLATLDQVCA